MTPKPGGGGKLVDGSNKGRGILHSAHKVPQKSILPVGVE